MSRVAPPTSTSTTSQVKIPHEKISMRAYEKRRDTLGFNRLDNIFSPGERPNATIGRALRLVIMNALGIRPHEFDQSTQGTPAKYSCCIAENEEDSPWQPLHVERGFSRHTSTVTTQMVRSDLYVEHRMSQVPEELLLTIADSMSYAGAITQITEERILHGGGRDGPRACPDHRPPRLVEAGR